MKVLITIILMFLICMVHAQSYIDFLSPARNIGVGNEILFSNPRSINKTWAVDSSYTGTIIVPNGTTSVTWELVNHDTGASVATGSSLSVTHTFTDLNSNNNVYDLEVLAYIPAVGGFRERAFVGEITVRPQWFSEGNADVVFDLTGRTGQVDHDLGWVNRPGYKIYVKGNCSCRYNPYYPRSDDPTNPVVFQFNGNVITSSTFGFTPGPSKNTIYTGRANRYHAQHLRVVKATSGSNQNVLIDVADDTRGGENTVIEGVEVDNVSTSYGGAGIQVQTQATATRNYDNYTMDKLVLRGNKVSNARDEAFYIGHFSDNDLNGSFYWSGFSNSLFYDNEVVNAGNDGIQVGSTFDSEVFHNIIGSSGTRDQASHRNQLQISPGNRNMSVYMNTSDGSRNILSAFTGRRGKDIEIFANTFYSTGRSASDGVNVFARMEQNDTYSSMDWAIFNNTFVMSTYLPFSIYEDSGNPTTIWNPLNIVDNIIVTNTATTNEQVNSPTNTFFTISNYQVTNSAFPLFVDFAGKDLHLSSLSSPAFQTLHTFTRRHRYAEYDAWGYKRVLPVMGADNATMLQTGN